MPLPRRLRRSLLECAQCTEGRLECSKARPQCDECKTQRLSCRYDQPSPRPSRRQSDPRARKATLRKSKASSTSDSSYAYSSSSSSPSPPGTDHARSHTSSSSDSSTESPFPTMKLVDRSRPPRSPQADPATGGMSPADQDLWDNWCSSTEHSITNSKNKDRSWQAVIRREEPGSPPLHHSILALSAIERASTSAKEASKQTHLQAARDHYTRAVDILPKVPRTSSSECNAAFSAASLLFMCELASSALAVEDPAFSTLSAGTQRARSSPSLDQLLDLMSATRTLSSSSPTMIDTVEHGELEALFTSTDPYHQLPSTYTLTILTMRNLNLTTAREDASHERTVYDDAIAKLDNSLEMLSKGGDPTMIALRWMFRIPLRFLDLVREQQPLALIIFAHYCAVLHHLRDRWWMGDWGTRLVKEISQLLGPDRMTSILWAADIVGVQT
ncbi:hypothetical protein BJX61DRAFT_302558 [Aspergillus egyptiacus]|nr:hypothetical protein BJX61DRAFT_302558 [Aspergillus egyptiacus]